MLIEKRRVDNRGRILLPLRGIKEVFVCSLGRTYIISEDKGEIDRIVSILNEKKIEEKKKAIKNWFAIVEATELEKMSVNDLNKIIVKSIKKEVEKSG